MEVDHVCGSHGSFATWRFYAQLRDSSNENDDSNVLPRFLVFQTGDQILNITAEQFLRLDRRLQLEKLQTEPSGQWRLTIESSSKSWKAERLVSEATRFPAVEREAKPCTLPLVIDVQSTGKDPCINFLSRRLGFARMSLQAEALSEKLGIDVEIIVQLLRTALSKSDEVCVAIDKLMQKQQMLEREVHDLGDEMITLANTVEKGRNDNQKLVNLLGGI